MRVNWETKRLADVAELRGRIGWKGLTAKEYTPDGPYFLSVHSLNYGDYVDFQDAFHISQERYDESPEIMLRRDDVLICKDGAGIGKVGIVRDMPGPSTINSSLLLMRTKPSILPKFLYLILQSPYFQEIVQSRLEGATTPHLYQRDIATFPIYLPPIEEQRQIVRMLNKAFSAIATATANTKRNIANARELFEAGVDRIIDSASTRTSVGPLDEVGGRVFTGPFGSLLHKRDYAVGGIPLVNPSHIVDGRIIPGANEAVSMETAQRLSNYRMKSGDIVFGRRGEMGRCAVVADDEDGFLCGTGSFFIRPCANTDPHFLAQLLRSRRYRSGIEALASGATMPNLSNAALSGLEIALPEESAQKSRIAEVHKLEMEISGFCDSASRKVRELASLKQSLLHRAFAGELRERQTTVQMPSNDDFVTPEFAAQVLAFAYAQHLASGRSANFGRVKAQKTLQSIEAIGGLDLGRLPIKDAAGPNDFAHMLRAEDWAKSQRFFEFVQRSNGGYNFRPLEDYGKLLDGAKVRLDQAGAAAKRAIELLVDMDSDFAEIVVTAHAAWNNLILDQGTITDDTIVQAARDDWHRDKLRFDKSRFHDAVRFIRNNGIVPDGSAKRVGGQASLPL